jgi:hypothetical protein
MTPKAIFNNDRGSVTVVAANNRDVGIELRRARAWRLAPTNESS